MRVLEKTSDMWSNKFRFSTSPEHSLWIYHLSLSCCSLEAIAAAGPKFDWERMGCRFVNDHREADILLVSGPVTSSLADELKKIYSEMREPKYVVAAGVCACTGGMFSESKPHIVRGLDVYIPVDLFIPGCPPRPESFIHAILSLQGKISGELHGS